MADIILEGFTGRGIITEGYGELGSSITPPALVGGYMPRMYCTPADVYGLFGNFARRIPLTTLLQNIQDATGYFENQCNDRIIQETTYTEELPALRHRGEMGIRVRAYPILSVASILLRNSSDGSYNPVSDPTKIDFIRQPLRFVYYTGPEAYDSYFGRPAQFSRGRSNSQVLITYTAGFAPLKREVRLAVASIAMEMNLRSINPYGSSSISSSAEGASNSLSLGDLSMNLALAEKVITKYAAWE